MGACSSAPPVASNSRDRPLQWMVAIPERTRGVPAEYCSKLVIDHASSLRRFSRSRLRPGVLVVRRAFGPYPGPGSLGIGGLISGPRQTQHNVLDSKNWGGGPGERGCGLISGPDIRSTTCLTRKFGRSGRAGRRLNFRTRQTQHNVLDSKKFGRSGRAGRRINFRTRQTQHNVLDSKIWEVLDRVRGSGMFQFHESCC